MSDPTEPIWRGMIENAEPVADLAADRGQTWTTAQLQADFEVLSFVAPFMVVRRRKDGQLDSLEFTHEPASTSAGRRTADMPFQLSPDEVPGVAASAAVGKLTGDRLGDIRDALFLGQVRVQRPDGPPDRGLGRGRGGPAAPAGRNARRSALVSSAKPWRPCARPQAASRRAAVTYWVMVPGLLCRPAYGSQSAKPARDASK
jgi:hypothetical protein